MKSTLVIGASENSTRYSNIAAIKLMEHKYPVILFGQKTGQINGVEIQNEWNSNWKVDTITLYLNPTNQIPYYQKIIDLKPKRVIFNPGTENPDFIELLKANKIETEVACTLVLLSLGKY